MRSRCSDGCPLGRLYRYTRDAACGSLAGVPGHRIASVCLRRGVPLLAAVCAGRVRAGVAVHLFPRAHYKKLTEFPIPELCRSPLDDVCLLVKSLGIGNIQVCAGLALQSPLQCRAPVVHVRMYVGEGACVCLCVCVCVPPP